LIVDDDADQRQTLAALLGRAGYDVEVASNGNEAFAHLRQRPVDLVLLDVGMPGENGFAVCKKIQHSLSHPPSVLFLTGRADPEACVYGLDVGGQDYIVKPFEPDELEARIRAALRAKRTIDELASQVSRDPLTGLLNRTELDERLNKAIATARRNERPLCALMIDVDRFKSVNDTLGHSAGDAVLVETARRIADVTRPSDSLFRYGGEEFFLVVPETSLAEAAKLAERLRMAISSTPFDAVAAGSLRVTVSIGVATWRPGRSAQVLVDAADEALYAAKSAGRDRVVSGT
jgi:diguanylate cyclase (GGDEF)-like protein